VPFGWPGQVSPPSGQTFGKLLFSILDHPDWSEVSPQGRKSKMCRARTCSVVYGALMYVGRDRECFPCSWMTIEELAKVSHSTMARCLAWLEGAGFLVRSTQLAPRTKRRTTTIWRLTIPPEHSKPKALCHPQRHQAPGPEESRLRAMCHPEPSCRCTVPESEAVESVPEPKAPSAEGARTPPAATTRTSGSGEAPEQEAYGSTQRTERTMAAVSPLRAKPQPSERSGARQGYTPRPVVTSNAASLCGRCTGTAATDAAKPVSNETAASSGQHDRHPSTPGAQAVVKLQRQRWTTPGLWNTDKQVQAPTMPLPY